MMQGGKACAASNLLVLLSDDLPDLKSSSLLTKNNSFHTIIAPALFAVAIICSAAAAARSPGKFC